MRKWNGVIQIQPAERMNRAGKKDAGYHVGQGAQMLPLAIAYDRLWEDFTPAQRQQITTAMIDFSIRPTLAALFKAKPWWVTGMNNWTTIRLNTGFNFRLILIRNEGSE